MYIKAEYIANKDKENCKMYFFVFTELKIPKVYNGSERENA